MTRGELRKFIENKLARIQEKFDLKNESYGADEDAFHNFEEAARRWLGSTDLEAQFRILMIYMDKHLIALANRGLGEREADDRLEDIMVYTAIASAMQHELKCNYLENQESGRKKG